MHSVEEYAKWRGITPQRVRELLRDGNLPGNRLGERQWAIEDSAFNVRRALGRPMSQSTAWDFIAFLSDEPRTASIKTRPDRLLSYRSRLRDAGFKAPDLLATWLRLRGDRLVFRAQAEDARELLDDPRVMRSGVSDHRSGVGNADVAEVWLRDPGKRAAVLRDYLLIPAPAGNVVLHVGSNSLESSQAPIGLVIADLADWNGPREDGRVVDLIAGINV